MEKYFIIKYTNCALQVHVLNTALVSAGIYTRSKGLAGCTSVSITQVIVNCMDTDGGCTPTQS